jgi:hypothetical protein
MTRVVISQPMLFPWPGFFEQLSLADVYVDLDDVQFSKGSFTNRVQLRWNDERRWLTIPLAGSGTFKKISDLEAVGTKWRVSHRDLLAHSVKGAPYRDDALALLDESYRKETVCEMLIASIDLSAEFIGLAPARRIRSSVLNLQKSSTERVLDIVKHFRGTKYITGHGATNYLDHRGFEQAEIEVEYMKYSLTQWPIGRRKFTPYVSILDLIAWTGPKARDFLAPETVPWRDFIASADSRRVSLPETGIGE